MREIKFRAWDKKRSRWATDNYTATYQGAWFSHKGSVLFRNSQSPEVELTQYTGLKDKNGKEIYEGDILLTDEAGWKAPVVYQHGCFMLIVEKPIKQGGGFSAEPNWKECEVIGNIYENPELLE